MPTYQIIINGEKTEDFVSGTSYMDAYFNATKMVPHSYNNDFKLVEVDQSSDITV